MKLRPARAERERPLIPWWARALRRVRVTWAVRRQAWGSLGSGQRWRSVPVGEHTYTRRSVVKASFNRNDHPADGRRTPAISPARERSGSKARDSALTPDARVSTSRRSFAIGKRTTSYCGVSSSRPRTPPESISRSTRGAWSGRWSATSAPNSNGSQSTITTPTTRISTCLCGASETTAAATDRARLPQARDARAKPGDRDEGAGPAA